jgi:hypothetical protein
VGFTGACGGYTSFQSVSDFIFVPLATLSAKVSGGNLVLSWPLQPGGYSLQTESDLTADNWQPVGAAVTTVGGQNQASIPVGTGKQFFRLVAPLPPP